MCPVENEYKFTSENVPDVKLCIVSIEAFLKRRNIDYSISEKQNTDYYYDSKNMEITDSGCFLRKRVSKNGTCKLTIKKPISNKGSMSREEIEIESDGSFEDLVKFSESSFSNVILVDSPTLVIVSDRLVFSINDEMNAKMMFDVCKFIDDSKSKSFWEIELEVISDNAKTDFDVHGIGDFITNDLGFRAITESKYSRGLKWKVSSRCSTYRM